VSQDALAHAEKILAERFTADSKRKRVLPSTAEPDTRKHQDAARASAVVLPDNQRAKLPFTKDKYLVKENPLLVFWERETRKFLRKLSPTTGHRISAVMIYEWATGLSIQALEKQVHEGTLEGRATWRTDLRVINKLLRHYFGDARMTYIAGRKVPKAYTVRPGYYIKRHRPMTLTLYAEFVEGTLVA
jgi:hypothetical protein